MPSSSELLEALMKLQAAAGEALKRVTYLVLRIWDVDKLCETDATT